jgi:hypothetical protein
MPAYVMGFGCRPTRPVNGHQGRRPKAAKERNRGEWGTRRISGIYGELVGTVVGACAPKMLHRQWMQTTEAGLDAARSSITAQSC